ncbi:FAD/NAD(P)-binding domain-containing protein [Hortaea werneckii]|nr:FAD/NAD(P)-binding domain-containing protein [Hortaea werneckii]KAI6850135.1 FAD/NAD(P)-binding domain-containing protein [Hortaea werneckii]KAI6940632.1 FAD/NAD(P)-binding domain-containing protein [Hortaea werneckii]KAI6941808.1 FAD/NAD(P)-binding domain-containing protein [Hortaea werneckii]KAI6978929.1 FAD/NAD(P)-binding domain-containing protein [Hortaea werneckii]
MSAVPNLPEEVLRVHPVDPGLSHDSLLKYKSDVSHVEHAGAQRTGQSNGITHYPETNNATVPKQQQQAAHINPKATPQWQLHDRPIENQRPVRVIVIGAGYSGVYCGIRIPERMRNCSLAIYEKNAGIGGTWYENRYPGAACDVPSHSYQFSFNPKHDWSSLYAPSWEIREYIESTARKFGADRFVHLEHEVVGCRWDEAEGKWHVRVRKGGPEGEVFEDVADVVVTARGNLNTKQWPDIEGLGSFQGEVMHSAAWDEGYDFRNKRVGVIGSGSSAIQIIPKLQQVEGAHLNCFIRSRTWISPPLAHGVQEKLGMGEKFEFTEELKQQFREDPQAWLDFRLMVEADANNIHAVTLKGTPMQQGAQKAFEEGMKERLKKKPEYFDWLKPGFAPGCRRLTPGPGFLEALVEDNVSFVRDRIRRIEPKGVVTEDGKLHEIDVLICATGFYASAAPPFPVTGLDGHSLKDHWHTRATNYLSLATDRFPNLFMMLGPNGAIGEGSLTMMIESTGDYILRAIRKLQRDNIKSMSIKPGRVRDFTRYCDAYFNGTVYMDDCQSWYRKDGQGRSGDFVTGLWPGSTLHCIEALRSPRWEDFDYEYIPEENGSEVNQMAWLGNGWAVNQLKEQPSHADLGFYLMPQFQQRPVEGRPEDNEDFAVRHWSY